MHPKIGLTFASALRAFLRQDPDVIMVGEIRDKETAEIAIHASLTGHLVLSTIHTNDAAGAVTRLVEMEIEPFLVRSSVIGILAQRLVRMLCTDCKRALHADATTSSSSSASTPERIAWRRARAALARATSAQGVDVRARRARITTRPLDVLPSRRGATPACRTGFIGRRGIYELMMIDDAVGPLILKSADAQTHQARRDRAGHGHAARRRRAQGARWGSRRSKRSSPPRRKTCRRWSEGHGRLRVPRRPRRRPARRSGRARRGEPEGAARRAPHATASCSPLATEETAAEDRRRSATSICFAFFRRIGVGRHRGA